MELNFYKYQGAGNDFVILDNRASIYDTILTQDVIEKLCNRRFGIGADGLMTLEQHPDFDFEMKYYNADGRPGSMCGNGGRCLVAFAHQIGHIQSTCTFLAVDGTHQAEVVQSNWVDLSMNEVANIEISDSFLFMDTGSPHYIQFMEDIDALDIPKLGRAIRYSERFKVEGTNVNFVETLSNGIKVATYERGVEDETLSCGTGVTASAIAYFIKHRPNAQSIEVQTKGGTLRVRLETDNLERFTNIWLSGPADLVFRGKIEV